MRRPPPSSPLFPYTTLFRSERWEQVHNDKLLPSTTQVPERFELGTLPYEMLAGTSAAIDYIADLASDDGDRRDRKSTRLNSSHPSISYAVFCLKKKKTNTDE